MTLKTAAAALFGCLAVQTVSGCSLPEGHVFKTLGELAQIAEIAIVGQVAPQLPVEPGYYDYYHQWEGVFKGQKTIHYTVPLLMLEETLSRV